MAVNIIDRSGAEALIPETSSKEIVQGAIAQSVVLSQFRKLPNLSSKTHSMPVLNLLPVAGFVDGDTGLKGTTKAQWDKKKIVAEEIAVIVPIPEAVVDDADYDILGEISPLVQQSFGQVIDNAILFGVNKPSSWREAIVASAVASGNVVTETGDLFLDIFGEDGVIAEVEKDGFLPTGHIAPVTTRGKLRGLRDDNKQPLFVRDLRESSNAYALDGSPIAFSTNGAWTDGVRLITGDLSQAVYAIRQDLTVKLLTEAVIQDPATGDIAYNLAQQDMVALRFVMRLGWEVPNPINALNPNEETRFPFAVLQAAGE